MKEHIFKLVVMVLFFTTVAASCEKEDTTSLPPETQTGANTFGCYVNGELFLRERGSAGFGISSLDAQYFQATNVLKIFASSKKGGIHLHISNPVINVKKMLSWVRYSSYYYENVGEIILTRFDTVNGIVSGTFACEIPYYDEQNEKDSVIQITQGRFDIKWLEIKD